MLNNRLKYVEKGLHKIALSNQDIFTNVKLEAASPMIILHRRIRDDRRVLSFFAFKLVFDIFVVNRRLLVLWEGKTKRVRQIS